MEAHEVRTSVSPYGQDHKSEESGKEPKVSMGCLLGIKFSTNKLKLCAVSGKIGDISAQSCASQPCQYNRSDCRPGSCQ